MNKLIFFLLAISIFAISLATAYAGNEHALDISHTNAVHEENQKDDFIASTLNLKFKESMHELKSFLEFNQKFFDKNSYLKIMKNIPSNRSLISRWWTGMGEISRQKVESQGPYEIMEVMKKLMNETKSAFKGDPSLISKQLSTYQQLLNWLNNYHGPKLLPIRDYPIQKGKAAEKSSKLMCSGDTPYKVTLYRFFSNNFSCHIFLTDNLSESEIIEVKKNRKFSPLLIKKQNIYYYWGPSKNKNNNLELELGTEEELREMLPSGHFSAVAVKLNKKISELINSLMLQDTPNNLNTPPLVPDYSAYLTYNFEGDLQSKVNQLLSISTDKNPKYPALITSDELVYYYDGNNAFELGPKKELKTILPPELPYPGLAPGRLCELIRKKGGKIQNLDREDGENFGLRLARKYILHEEFGHASLGVQDDKGNLVNFISWPSGYSYHTDLKEYNFHNPLEEEKTPDQISFCISKERYLNYMKKITRSRFFTDREDTLAQDSFTKMKKKITLMVSELTSDSHSNHKILGPKLKKKIVNFFNANLSTKSSPEKLAKNLMSYLTSQKSLKNFIAYNNEKKDKITLLIGEYLKEYNDYQQLVTPFTSDQILEKEKENKLVLASIGKILRPFSFTLVNNRSSGSDDNKLSQEIENCIFAHGEYNNLKFKSASTNCEIIINQCSDPTLIELDSHQKQEICKLFNRYQNNLFRIAKQGAYYGGGKQFYSISGLLGTHSDSYNCMDAASSALQFILDDHNFYSRHGLTRIPSWGLTTLQAALRSLPLPIENNSKSRGIAPLIVTPSLVEENEQSEKLKDHEIKISFEKKEPEPFGEITYQDKKNGCFIHINSDQKNISHYPALIHLPGQWKEENWYALERIVDNQQVSIRKSMIDEYCYLNYLYANSNDFNSLLTTRGHFPLLVLINDSKRDSGFSTNGQNGQKAAYYYSDKNTFKEINSMEDINLLLSSLLEDMKMVEESSGRDYAQASSQVCNTLIKYGAHFEERGKSPAILNYMFLKDSTAPTYRPIQAEVFTTSSSTASTSSISVLPAKNYSAVENVKYLDEKLCEYLESFSVSSAYLIAGKTITINYDLSKKICHFDTGDYCECLQPNKCSPVVMANIEFTLADGTKRRLKALPVTNNSGGSLRPKIAIPINAIQMSLAFTNDYISDEGKIITRSEFSIPKHLYPILGPS